MPVDEIKTKREELVNKLDALGFYQYNSPEETTEIKAKAIETGYIWDWVRGRVNEEPDFEDLVEGLADSLLESLMPLLNLRGIQIARIETEHTPDTYTLTVD